LCQSGFGKFGRCTQAQGIAPLLSPHEIPLLVSDGVLKPLGHPAQNAPKFFALVMLEELRRDAKWLSKASETICQHWKDRKERECETVSHGRNGVLTR
jgi:hypothetical protein